MKEKWGYKTIYKGKEFRSSLETEMAYLLDSMNLKWLYELKRFRLSNGKSYLPDFYLPELKIWIETKGVIEDFEREICELFVQEYEEHLLLISKEEVFYYGNEYGKEVYEDSYVSLGKCSKCDSYFFSSNFGLYNCKKCGNHEGDHDLLGKIEGLNTLEDWRGKREWT